MGAALCSNGTKVIPKAVIRTATANLKRDHDKLWTAVENNDLKQAELYLDFNEITEANLYDQQGQTMLHLAAQFGHADMLMLLIERTGAKPDMVNQQLATPLHLACRSDRQTVVKFLLGFGVDVNIQDEHGQTPLLVCCVHGCLEIVQMLVEASISGHLADPLEVDLVNNQGLTPLNCAAIKGDYEMTKCLVSRGGAKVDQASPKGCTPLIYAGRGGYCQVVEYLLLKKASPLKQDNAGGTVLHHAVEKSHLQVLETMVSVGVDVYSAIEIADNAGRTPLFEAVEQDSIEIVKQLIQSKQENGYSCNLNVVNYNGQTPLFIAAKQGSSELVSLLLEAGAIPDLNQGELVKPEDDFEEGESAQEKNLMEAFKNSQTALQVAAVLGYEEITFKIAQKSDINFQTSVKGYTVLHLCVLANRPELIIEFLTKHQANPMIEDKLGRTLLDMIYQYIPSYIEIFQSILETMQIQVTPQIVKDDDRQITGVQGDTDKLYQQTVVNETSESLNFELVDLSEQEGFQNSEVQKVYGKQIALCLALQSQWQLKEQAMRKAVLQTEKYLTRSEVTEDTFKLTFTDLVVGALSAVNQTCKEKIIKVFNQSLQLFNLVTQSSRVEKDPQAHSAMLSQLPQIIKALLEYSEQTNQRVCGKIHESLIDLSYSITPDLVTDNIYSQLQNKPSAKASQVHLSLLYKICQQFIVHKTNQDSLTWYLVLEQVMPFLAGSNADLKQLATRVLVEVQAKTGLITEQDFDSLNSQSKQQVWGKLAGVKLSEQLTDDKLESYQKIIGEKARSKDWTQREIALVNLQELSGQIADLDEAFMQQCLQLLQQSLDDRNIQIYLLAVGITLTFVKKFSAKEVMMDVLPALLQSVIVRTTDTNTRVRKQSCELVSQVWDLPLHKKSSKQMSQIIAQLVTEQSEKAIVGRIGLLVQRAKLIEDLSKKSLNLVLGHDYDHLTQFACQWILHKSTKVRQSASRLVVEICRLNFKDQRGVPFKPQILQYVLGLRQSIREPLIKKINEVCPSYINEAEYEVGMACKNITLNEGALPSVTPQVSAIQPQLVLPHSEPLTQDQLDSSAVLIELFGVQLVTCFYSQTWSSRLAALDKISEQMQQLDPNRRDAMLAEINRNNLPPEISFKTLLKVCEEGLKDPVLKNYLRVLNVIQEALPLYFKYLRTEQIKRDLTPLIGQVINKTADMKQKVREASMNFILYLSHQFEAESLCQMVLKELDFDCKSIGNSAMITSCLQLVSQLQSQSKFIKSADQSLFTEVTKVLNQGLKHQNPQVRKQSESLFKVMFADFPDYQKQLQGQKAQLVTKLIADCKEVQEQTLDEVNSHSLDTTLVSEQFGQELLSMLRSANHKQRLQAIVELKKTIQQKLTQLNSKTAFKLLEPSSMLLRHLLQDENTDVYIEALGLLKFTVGNLAQHLSQLDLHLMMGSYITLIVSEHQIRARVASDKVIIYFSKHSGIGSLVVAKEILKQIERFNRAPDHRIVRYYGLLQMLIQQFSIVLCYQPEFIKKCLELVADSMGRSQDEPQVKSAAQSLVTQLYQIDPKNLESQVNQLDFTKKTHIKKVIIELENSTNKGLVQVKRPGSPAQSFTDTQQSFTSSRLVSPSMSKRLQQKSSKENFGQTESQWPSRPLENLPTIERRRVPGQGFIGTKAAGFNRNDFSQTDYRGMADISNMGLMNAPTKQKNEDKLTNVPLYVPTQRTQIKRRDENTFPQLVKSQNTYTPTLLQKRL